MLLEWWRRGGLCGNVSGGLRGRMRGHIRGRLRGSTAAAALWAHGALAADVSLAIAPTNWVTCAPIATATFAAGLDAAVLEWAPGDAGAFTQIATCPDPSAESWTVELPGTVVGQPRRYRLAMTSGGSTSTAARASTPSAGRRSRRPRGRLQRATTTSSSSTAASTPRSRSHSPGRSKACGASVRCRRHLAHAAYDAAGRL